MSKVKLHRGKIDLQIKTKINELYFFKSKRIHIYHKTYYKKKWLEHKTHVDETCDSSGAAH